MTHEHVMYIWLTLDNTIKKNRCMYMLDSVICVPIVNNKCLCLFFRRSSLKQDAPVFQYNDAVQMRPVSILL